MKKGHWVICLFCLTIGCAAQQQPAERSAGACPMRPTTTAKEIVAGQLTWIIVTVVHPLNRAVSCEGDYQGGESLKNLIRLAGRERGREDPARGSYYGLSILDCVCEGEHGYTSFIRQGTPVVYCLSPEEAVAIRTAKDETAHRSD